MEFPVNYLCNIIIFTNMNHVLFLLSKSKSKNLHSDFFIDFMENVILSRLNIGDMWVIRGLVLGNSVKMNQNV